MGPPPLLLFRLLLLLERVQEGAGVEAIGSGETHPVEHACLLPAPLLTRLPRAPLVLGRQRTFHSHRGPSNFNRRRARESQMSSSQTTGRVLPSVRPAWKQAAAPLARSGLPEGRRDGGSRPGPMEGRDSCRASSVPQGVKRRIAYGASRQIDSRALPDAKLKYFAAEQSYL